MRKAEASQKLSSLLPGWLCGLLGRWRRKKGLYDRRTLECFYRGWRSSDDSRDLLAYFRFRRDLGLKTPFRPLKGLLASWVNQDQKTRRALLNLLEVDNRNIDSSILPSEELIMLAPENPAAAALLAQRGVTLYGHAGVLAQLQAKQDNWRAGFAELLNANRESICVVGNAGALQGAGCGPAIDSSELVVRFNQFATLEEPLQSSVADVGKKLGVWVCAPGLEPPYPQEVDDVEWVILTGPDIRYQLSQWQYVVPLLRSGKKVLTVPLGIWRILVRELEAPPSAGVLCLAWFIEMLGTAEGIQAAGFQRTEQPDKPYHFVLPGHKAVKRHNWAGERRFMAKWESDGLDFLD